MNGERVSRRKLSDIEQAVVGMSANFVHCRDWNHNWGPHRVDRIRGGWERTLRCKECGSLRRQLLDSDFNYITRPRTYYAEGYLLKGLGRLSAADKAFVRRESILDQRGERRG